MTRVHPMLASVQPPFFIVGAPKCGTSAWVQYLRDTPSVFVPKIKEAHHFATDLLRPGDPFRDPRHHANLFQAVDGESTVGQAATYDLYSRSAARNIAAFRGDGRIIIMLRDPVDLLHAYHAQLVYSGAEPVGDFETALRTSVASGDDESTRLIGVRDYLGVAGLDVQIQRYLDLFTREQVHFVIFDDLLADTEATFRRTLEFLNVSEEPNTRFERVNAGKDVRSRLLRDHLLNRPQRVVHAVGRMIPRRIRWRMRRFALQANAVPAERSSMPSSLRGELRDYFKPIVLNLELLVERDLSVWY